MIDEVGADAEGESERKEIVCREPTHPDEQTGCMIYIREHENGRRKLEILLRRECFTLPGL